MISRVALRSTFLKIILLVAAYIPTSNAFAESLDGYIGLFSSYGYPLFKTEYKTLASEGRVNFRLEAGRFSENIGIDLRVGFRSNYSDYGATFRMFDTVSETSTMLVQVGLGLGVMYSPGFTASEGISKISFIDVLVNPFVRAMFDSHNGIGFTADLGVEVVPERSFSSTNTATQNSDGLKTHVVMAVGVMFDYDNLLSDDEKFIDTLSQQSELPKDFQMGFKIGLPYSFLSTTDAAGSISSQSFAPGLMFGIGFDASPTAFGFMGDVLYVKRAYGGASDSVITLTRIEIPFRARYRVSRYLYGTFGGYIGYGFGTVAVKDSAGTTVSSTYAEAAQAHFCYGPTAGIGFVIPGRGTDFNAELRYVLGMANMNVLATGEENLRESAVDFVLGVMF